VQDRYCNVVLGAFKKLRKGIISFVNSVSLFVLLSAWNNSAPLGRILVKSDIGVKKVKVEVTL